MIERQLTCDHDEVIVKCAKCGKFLTTAEFQDMIKREEDEAVQRKLKDIG